MTIDIPLLALSPLSTFAYLDPGSGSMLLSAIIGIVATLYFVLKSFAYKLIHLPSFLMHKKAGVPKTSNIVFYSEGERYWNVFSPILHELNAMGVPCTYLSSEENDSGLACELENVETRYIGTGNRAFFMLNTLQAKVCVTTTPGLDVLQMKRSKGVDRYCHVTHSAGGVSGYSTYGLDYYDVVLVGGNGDEEMIRDIESSRNIPVKDIHVVGCTYLDVLRQRLSEVDVVSPFAANGRKTILISPTWGQHGLLNKFGAELLKVFTEAEGFNMIIRPHPQSFVSDKPMIESLMESFPQGEFLVWDRQPDGLVSMVHADAMISDFSGIIFDFLFLFNRPVLSFGGEYDKRGKDAMDLPGDSWNIKALATLGGACTGNDIPHLPKRIEELLNEGGFATGTVYELRKGMDKYPGESGSRAAQVIVDLLTTPKERREDA